MPASFYIVASVANLLLSVIQLLMTVRAIISWFPISDDNAFVHFLYGATEPFIIPVRGFLDHFGLFRDMPIDISFLITFFLLSFLQIFL